MERKALNNGLPLVHNMIQIRGTAHLTYGVPGDLAIGTLGGWDFSSRA
jgi:hypothetical protein